MTGRVNAGGVRRTYDPRVETPRALAPRLRGVDAARGIALLAMMSVHIFPLIVDGVAHPAARLVSGRAAALFAVLAGVGLALGTGGPRPAGGRRLLAARAGTLARAVLLAAVGLFLGSVESPPAVILVYYAVLFVVALPVLGLRAPVLAALAVAAAVVAPVVSHLARMRVDDPTGDDLAPSLGLEVVVTELLLTGYYPVLPWTAYLLAGLAVGRLQLGSTRVAAAVAAGGLVMAVAARAASAALLGASGGREVLERTGREDGYIDFYGVDLVLETGMFGLTPTTSWWWLAVAAPHSSTTLDLVHTTGTSMLVLGVCLLVARHAGALLWPLAAAGSMTFTLYSAHVLALRGDDGLGDRTVLYAMHVVAAVTVATVWRAFARRGPLEALAALLSRAAIRAVQSPSQRAARS